MAMYDISGWLWLAALAPLAIIFYLLTGRQWKVSKAAPVGYLLASLIGIVVFGASLYMIFLLTLKGIWQAVTILYVVVPALLLYLVAREAGTFDVLRRGIAEYTPNNLLHVLAFGWVFSSFLQGVTGFGVPALVTAPLLVAMGVKPLWAVAITLIGHAWACTFGTLAVAWEGLTAVTDMQNPGGTAAITAFMLLLVNYINGFIIAWFFGRWQAIREALPAVLIIGSIQGLGQLFLASRTPELSNLLPGTVALGAVLLLAKSRWYSKPTAITDSQVMQPSALGGQAHESKEKPPEAAGDAKKRQMGLGLAMLPYVVLIALILGVRLIPVLQETFSAVQFGFPFPRLETSRGFVIEAVAAYRPFRPLTHAGTFLLLSALVTFVAFRRRGDIHPGGMASILGQTAKTSLPAAIAFLTLLPLTKAMEGSGQTIVLALGIANFAPPLVYAFMASVVGVLGSFMTSSNLSSNILFGSLQESTASTLGLSQEVILAAQTAGAAVGNAFAPGNVLMAATATGIQEKTGAIIRLTTGYVLLAGGLVGLIAVLGAWFALGGP